MALVDHERVLTRLKAVIASKPHHGQRDLLAEIARLEGEESSAEDDYHRFLHRFGVELEEAFLNVTPNGALSPIREAAAPASQMAGAPEPSSGLRATKEDVCRTTPEAPPPPQTRSIPTLAPSRTSPVRIRATRA